MSHFTAEVTKKERPPLSYPFILDFARFAGGKAGKITSVNVYWKAATE